jgi:Flp pilus assembly protein TadD
MLQRGAALVLVLALQACALQDSPQELLERLPAFTGAGAPVDTPVPEPAELLATDAEMRSFVREHILPIRDPVVRLRELVALLHNPGYMGIRYEAGLTLTAAETFKQRAGNCLSYSALLVALAREVGLDASFQDVPVLPNWRLANDTFLIERHVNTLVKIGRREFVVDFRPPEAVARAHARRISDANAAGHYYGNLGVERLADDDLGGAYRLFRRGIEADPGSGALWINLGVALARNGQGADAEDVYRLVLAREPRNLSALNNLAALQASRGKVEEASDLSARLESYRRANPYYMYLRGESLLRDGDYEGAEHALAAALRKLPNEADFHLAMARAQIGLGRQAAARTSLDSALALAATESERARFEAIGEELFGELFGGPGAAP